MKTKHKIIALSVFFTLLVWIFDSAIGAFIFYEENFFEMLIFKIPPHEIYVRFCILVTFIVFGLIISTFIERLKLTEDTLLASEEKYRLLFEGAGDAIFMIDLEGENAGQIVDANKAAADMHGYSVDEMLKMNISNLDTPEAARKVPNRIQRILTGEWLKVEITHRKKDGTVFPVEISAGLLEIHGHKYTLAIDRDYH